MRNILMATMLLALCVPPLVLGSTYQWRDANGSLHFTDDPDRIPAAYLERAREIESVKPEVKPNPAPKAPASAASPGQVSGTAKPAAAAAASERARLAAELKSLQEALVVKKKELARLHHKWSVVKGRTPTEDEVKKFEKKRDKGEATSKDNPYVNKNPLSSPAPARAAYFKKLQEVQKDEERARQIEQSLQALNR
ncbi:MAG TPA: DUF4124 domain-containing protein [Geobacter sp.]|nr:DUF4124 domain-containing protein [Geobacter sp.]